jgi:hypothetical protein
MENIRLIIDTDRSMQVGAFGYVLSIQSKMPLSPDFPVEIIIKNNKTNDIKIKTVEVVDAEQGIIEYTVEEDDFTTANSHDIQIRQVGSDFTYLSPTETIPIFRSINV